MRKVLATGVVSAILAGLSFWTLFEVDLFHQIRAGQEILDGFKFFGIDHWTYTVAGQPWYPNGWLSYTLFALLYKFFGYGGLSFLRSFMVFSWACLLGKMLNDKNDDMGTSLLKILILIPMAYLICLWRIHVRPDMVAVVLFASLLVIWSSKYFDKFKIPLSVLVLFLWSNIHSGTFLFGIIFFTSVTVFATEIPLWKKFLWSAAALLMWIANPLGFDAVRGFFINIFEYSGFENRNEDQLSFLPKMLKLSYGAGWSYVLWAFYTSSALVSLVTLYFDGKMNELPGPYKKPLFTFALTILLTIITFLRIRGALYQITFLSPILGTSLSIYLRGQRKRQMTVALVSLAAALPIISETSYVLGGRRLGIGIAENFVPVHAVDYLKKLKIEGHIFNHLDFGDILTHRAPEIPIAIDGRDVPFIDLRKKWESPRGFSDFLEQNQVTVIFDKTSMTSFPYGNTLWAEQEWAPVFLDNSAVIYLKRIPSYSKIIEKDEYRVIFEDMKSPRFFQEAPQKFLSDLAVEINRCLSETSVNVFCLYRKAVVLERMNKFNDALDVLDEAYSWEPWNPSVRNERLKIKSFRTGTQ